MGIRMTLRPRLKHLPPLAALSVLALLVFLQIRFPTVFSSARQLVSMPTWSPAPRRRPRRLPCVGIDEDSLARHGSWPWPDFRLAQLIDRVRDRGATAIGLALIPDQRASPATPASTPLVNATELEKQSATTLASSLAAVPSVVGFA
ncbi:MAG: CHASE2 domain-containing protein, partial [Thiohalocapsa sp.]